MSWVQVSKFMSNFGNIFQPCGKTDRWKVSLSGRVKCQISRVTATIIGGRGRNWLSGVTGSCSSCCRNLLNCHGRRKLFIKPTETAQSRPQLANIHFPTPTPFAVAVAHFCHLPIGLARPIFTSLLLRSEFALLGVRGQGTGDRGEEAAARGSKVFS